MRKYKDVSHKLKYSIKGEYPRVDAAVRPAQIFNREIRLKISRQYAYATRPNWSEFRDHVKVFPKEDPLETAEFNYEIMYANEDIVSVRFHDVTYSYGAAHPLESYFSITFDFSRGVPVPVATLFRADSHFLNRLIKLSKAKLDEQEVFTFPDAVEAELKRHVEWNVTAKGLVINFDRCAITACADGERSILIPYDDLNDILRRDDDRFSRLFGN